MELAPCEGNAHQLTEIGTESDTEDRIGVCFPTRFFGWTSAIAQGWVVANTMRFLGGSVIANNTSKSIDWERGLFEYLADMFG